MAVRFVFWLPTLALVAVGIVVGLRAGPWWPLGVAAATVATVGAASWVNRDVRRLRTIAPADAQRMADARTAHFGRLFGRWMAVWLVLSALLVVTILVAHFA